MSMIVHNIKGTSDRNPKGYGSWIDFWLKKNKCGITTLCACCNESTWEVGGHVQEHGNETRDFWYIVPLCKKCNNVNNNKTFNVDKNQLVKVNDND